MLALSIAEGFARTLFRFHPARLRAQSRLPSKSFISSARNSFVSPTYAKTGGCIPPKMLARRHFLSRLSQFPLSALDTSLPAAVSAEACFQSLVHSFIFRIQPISRPCYVFRTLH